MNLLCMTASNFYIPTYVSYIQYISMQQTTSQHSDLRITTYSAHVSVGQQCGRGLLRQFCGSLLASLTSPSSQLSAARRPYLWVEWLSAVVAATLCQSPSSASRLVWFTCGSPRAVREGKPQATSTFQVSTCVAVVSLPRTGHMARLRVNVEEECIPRRWL